MLLLTLSIVLFVIIAFVVTWVELKRRKLSLKYRHIPGIKEYPIIGNIYTIRPNDITDIDILTTTCQVAPVSKVFITCKMYLLASDPQVVQEILTSKVCSDRPFLMKFFTFDYGLIPAECKLLHYFWVLPFPVGAKSSKITIQATIRIRIRELVFEILHYRPQMETNP